MWLERIAVFGVPIGAVLLTVLLLLGPGREQTVIGLRAHGLVTTGSEHIALRLRTMAHSGRRYRPVPRDSVELTVEHQGKSLGRWRGTTRPHGSAEAQIRLNSPLPPAAIVRVAIDGMVATTAAFKRSERLATLATREPKIPPTGQLTVHVPRGRALASFPERLQITAHVKTDSVEPSWPQLSLASLGTEIDEPSHNGPPTCSGQSCVYRWTAHYTPHAPTAQLQLLLRTNNKTPWKQAVTLPIANGGWWLKPGAETSRRATLRASGPREHVWVSLYDRDGRRWGARVETRIDHSGFSEANVNLPPLPNGAFRLVASSDFAENPATSWTLAPHREPLAEVSLGLVFDTLPPKVSLEQRRSQNARWPVFGLVLSAGFFELLYLLYRSRQSGAKLRAHFKAVDAKAANETLMTRPPLYWLVLASASLVAAFAALATLSLVVGR